MTQSINTFWRFHKRRKMTSKRNLKFKGDLILPREVRVNKLSLTLPITSKPPPAIGQADKDKIPHRSPIQDQFRSCAAF